MIALAGLHHVALGVADLDEASARWCAQFGLHRVGPGLLACDDEAYSLELLPGEPGCDHVAWTLARGCSVADVLSAVPGAVEVDGHAELYDPDGNAVHLLPWEPRVSPWVEHVRAPSGAPLGHPRRLGHVNFLTSDAPAQIAFWTDVMGLKLSDRLGEAGAWLRCSHFHHELAFVTRTHPPTPQLHHLAFDVVDAGQLRMTLDHLGRHGRWLGWGPTRHGVGGNVAAYVRITEEPLFVELYCDMELLEPDHEPREYPDDRYSSNTWGPLPPRSYFRFDAASVASERDSLEMLGAPR